MSITRRRLAAPAALVVVLAAIAAPAHSALTAVSPDTNPANDLPLWYQDETGLQLEQCIDGTDQCLLGVEGDEEILYWSATAAAGPASLTLAIEGVQAAPPLEPDPLAFGRIEVRITGAEPNSTYTVTHPFGVEIIQTDGNGNARLREETDGAFETALDTRIGPFLRWDPTVGPAPDGYIGDPTIDHAVVGSPFDTNLFRIEGPGVNAETDLFAVLGRVLDGEAPPATPFASHSPKSLSFGAQQVGSTSAAQTVTLTNRGNATLPINSVTLAGPNAGDYAIASNTCGTAVAALGGSCAIGVAFGPTATGARNATLSISDGAAGSPRTVSLTGTGTAAPAQGAAGAGAAGAGAGAGQAQSTPGAQQETALLRIAGLNLSRRIGLRTARRRGISASMVLPEGTSVLRVRLFRLGAGTSQRQRLLVNELRTGLRPGRYTVRLRSRRLRRQLRVGAYRLELTPGTARNALGRRSTATIRITR